MIWLLTRFVVLPVRAAAGGFRLGFRTGRVVGYRRLLLVGTGAAIGVLLAPTPGSELRARLRERLEGVPAPAPAAGPPPIAPDPLAPEPYQASAPEEGGDGEPLPAVPDADPAVERPTA